MTSLLEEPSLRVVGGERERGVVGLSRLRLPADPFQQVAPRGVEQVVAREVELVDRGQRRSGRGPEPARVNSRIAYWVITAPLESR